MDTVFNSNLYCIKSGSTLQEAKNVMLDKRVRHLPVINEKNQIIGMLSSHDLTAHATLLTMPVDMFASAPVKYVTTETPLSTVAETMLEKKISCVLICDNEKNAIGIITTDDLLFQFAKILKEKESTAPHKWTQLDILTTAGEFFRSLSNVGI